MCESASFTLAGDDVIALFWLAMTSSLQNQQCVCVCACVCLCVYIYIYVLQQVNDISPSGISQIYRTRALNLQANTNFQKSEP